MCKMLQKASGEEEVENATERKGSEKSRKDWAYVSCSTDTETFFSFPFFLSFFLR